MRITVGAGELIVKDITGDKDVTVYAGRVSVSGDPNQYGHADAKVLAGRINAPPLHMEKDGVFRFASRKGSGKNWLSVTILAGEVFITE
jgi:hypothetical protein